MAKRSKKCRDPNCLPCRWWPKIGKHMGVEQGCYWVDSNTGEVFIATGLRALPGGTLVPIETHEGSEFYEVECDCGSTGVIRGDLLMQGRADRCPECAANVASIARN